LVLLTAVSGYTLDYSLETAYPSNAPYYLGTQVKAIKVWIMDGNTKINSDYSFIEVQIGTKKLKLNKKDKTFSSSEKFYITSDNLTAGKLVLNVTTPMSNVTNKTKTYNVEDPAKYVKATLSTKDFYNPSQTIDLNVSLDYLTPDVSSPTCYLLNPFEKNNLFTCSTKDCYKKTKMPEDANNEQLLEVFCYVSKGESLIPIYIQKDLGVSNDLILTITNPEKSGVVISPLFLLFKLNYPNGLPLENHAITVYVDGKIKNITVLSSGEYQLNDLLVPYLNYKRDIKLRYNDKIYLKQVNIYLKPALWFWIFSGVVLFIILMNLILLFYRLFKREDVNELVAERNLYVDKTANLKKEFLAGKLTKSSYDELTKDYEFKIAYLNSKIIKLKKLSPEDQYKQIRSQIKSPMLENKMLPDDSLLKTIGSKEPKVQEKKPELKMPEIEQKEKKPGFFETLFAKKEVKEKTVEEKIAEVKKTLPKTQGGLSESEDNIDVNAWKK